MRERRLSILFLVASAPWYLNDFYIIFLTLGTLSDEKINWLMGHLSSLGSLRILSETYHFSENLGASRLAWLWGLDVLFYTGWPSFALWRAWRIGRLNVPVGRLKIVDGLFVAAALAVSLPLFNWVIDPALSRSLPLSYWFVYAFPRGPFLHWLTIAYAAISAGVLEEIVFRGILLQVLIERVGSIPWAAFLCGVAFALIHWCEGPAALISTFLWSFIPTALVLGRGNLAGAILFHTLFDFVSFSNLLVF